MKIFAIVLFSLASVPLIIALFYLTLHVIFEHKPNLIASASGTKTSTKHRKNVLVWGRSGSQGPMHVVAKIKDWSKSVYEYRVNGKTYKVSYVQFVPAGCMAFMEKIIYIKAFPCIAYVESETNSPDFLINAFSAFIISVLLVILGVVCII
jgi:hypothetical protein